MVTGYGFGGARQNLSTATVDATVTLASDLTVTKTASAATVAAGQAVTYTIVVRNSGGGTSSTYTLEDIVPQNFTNVQTSTAGCAVTGNTVSCANQPGLSQGSTKTFSLSATASSAGDTTNTATVRGTTGESNTTNNSATARVTVQTADLVIEKVASKVSYVAGETATFTMTVRNAGNTTSSAYTLTDAFPGQFSSVQFSGSTPPGCSITGNEVNCTNQTGLVAGALRTYTVTANASTVGSTITNTATLSDTANEPIGNNSGSATVVIQAAEADLTVTKTASPATGVVAGQTVTYTVTVKNSGNTTSSAYTLTDVVPDAFTSVGFSGPPPAGCTIAGNTVTCANQGALAPDATRSYSITAVANTTSAANTTNTATVSETTGEASTANNTASATVSIVDSVPDLSIQKTASSPTVNTGQQVSWTITVTNLGNNSSQIYAVTDQVPSQFTNVSASLGCAVNGNDVTCEMQSALAPGASKTYTVTATAPNVNATIRNFAQVQTPIPEANTANNISSADVTITTNTIDLVVTKTATPTTVDSGSLVTYTIEVFNAGSTPSNTYTLIDVVPAGLILEATPNECTRSGNTLTCANQPSLPADEYKRFILTAGAVDVATPTQITNTATVTSTGESSTDNNTGSATITVRPPADNTGNSQDGDFTITKSATSAEFLSGTKTLPVAGGDVVYQYTVTNNTDDWQILDYAYDDVCGSLTMGSNWDRYWDSSYRGYRYRLDVGQTGTMTCTQTVRGTVTNTVTVSMVDGYRRYWGSLVRDGLSTAKAEDTVYVQYSSADVCSITTFWGVLSNGLAYEYNVDGSRTSRAGIDTGDYNFDIAISPDARYLVGLRNNGDLRVWDLSTNGQVATIDVSYPGGHPWPTYGGTDGVANSLSFGADGQLYVGGNNYGRPNNSGGDDIFVVSQADFSRALSSGAATASKAYEGDGVADGGYAGDFITLPDGSLLAVVNTNGVSGGPSSFAIFNPDGTKKNVGFPAMPSGTSVYGATYSNGSLYLANSDGYWYRVDTIPSMSGSSATSYAVVRVGADHGTFYGATGVQETNAQCASANVNVAKGTGTVTGPDAQGVYTVSYPITVRNTGTTAGSYGPLTDTPSFDSVFTITGASWSGQTSGSATTQGPYALTTSNTNIAAGATHTYSVSIRFTMGAGTIPSECEDNSPGTGLFNAASLPPGAEQTTTQDNDACAPNPPFVDVVKVADSVSGPEAGAYAATYTVTVTNYGGAADTYGPLIDTASFAPGITVTGASWTATTQPFGGAAQTLQLPSYSATGPGPFTLAPTNQRIPAKTVDTYTMTVRFTMGSDVTARECTGAPGSGLYNAVTITGEDGPVDDNDDCLPPPTAVTRTIHVEKQGLTCDVGMTACPLEGAEFALYSADPTGAGAEPITDGIVVDETNGARFNSADLHLGEYWLVETKAPSGWALLPEPIHFNLTSEGIALLDPPNALVALQAGDEFSIVVSDASVGELPEAGGRGQLGSGLLAGLLMLAALGYYNRNAVRNLAPAAFRGK